jgi:hypothetical protein
VKGDGKKDLGRLGDIDDTINFLKLGDAAPEPGTPAPAPAAAPAPAPAAAAPAAAPEKK